MPNNKVSLMQKEFFTAESAESAEREKEKEKENLSALCALGGEIYFFQ